jgi:hypothetical protein
VRGRVAVLGEPGVKVGDAQAGPEGGGQPGGDVGVGAGVLRC